jgi:hypothetical protein
MRALWRMLDSKMTVAEDCTIRKCARISPVPEQDEVQDQQDQETP